MAACESPRENTSTLEQGRALEAPPATNDWTLPSDLLLEIVARSDISTVVAFTLACKILRHDILSPSFIRHLTQRGGILPPCILAYLHTHDDMDDPPPPLSLVHPATPDASAFLNRHIFPSVSRFADDLLAEHVPLTSHGGLVLFRRRRFNNKLSNNLCVYDIFSGHRTFFPYPPCGDTSYSTWFSKHVGDKNYNRWFSKYVLLTAEDGIDCSFLLFSLHHVTVPGEGYRSTIEVHTATPMSRTWASPITSHNDREFFSQQGSAIRENIVVLHGGVMHWLVEERGEIVSYDVCTREHGSIKLPSPVIDFNGQLHLGSYYSHDGKKLLRLFTYKGFKISVWHQLPSGDWALGAAMIDIEEKLRSVDPYGQNMIVEFECSGENNNIMLLRVNTYHGNLLARTLLIILDLETGMMRDECCATSSSMLMEIDLSSRLRAMKVLP